MESTCLLNHVKTRPENEMIRVTEDDAGIDRMMEFAGPNGFNASDRADRHEHRCFYDTMVGMERPSTGVRIRIGMIEREVQLARRRPVRTFIPIRLNPERRILPERTGRGGFLALAAALPRRRVRVLDLR